MHQFFGVKMKFIIISIHFFDRFFITDFWFIFKKFKIYHMKAAVINQFGGPDIFEVKDIKKPMIKPDQLLIKVKASSINPIDWKQRNGNHKLVFGSPFPIVLGYDISGEVSETGSEITKFKKGDQVYGVLDNKYGGALAEYAVGHEKCFSLKPKEIAHEEAAALPMVGLTALQALRDHAAVREGQTILLNGASGGVGHIAIQIAKLMNTKVIAVASEKSKPFVLQYHPDEFIDYTERDIKTLNQKVDVFFDVIGNLSFPKTKQLLKPGGIYLNLNFLHSLTKLPINKFHELFSNGKRAKSFLMKHQSSDLEIISEWLIQQKIQVHQDKTFSLDQIQQAHEYAQKGHNKGKNVIVISE